MDDVIRFEFTTRNASTPWPCDVCGDPAKNVAVLCEVPNGEYAGMRCCEQCLKRGDVNTVLEEHVQNLEQTLRELHGLIGRLQVPK